MPQCPSQLSQRDVEGELQTTSTLRSPPPSPMQSDTSKDKESDPSVFGSKSSSSASASFIRAVRCWVVVGVGENIVKKYDYFFLPSLTCTFITTTPNMCITATTTLCFIVQVRACCGKCFSYEKYVFVKAQEGVGKKDQASIFSPECNVSN